ncbi:hypothetical protein CF651_25810 [Paenibacillus rigui]|uniref:Uncharacterized protein n=1 Tax=Paenibacillus rigui TaxID=554312 RepID=A0A229UIZ4_9BACL|nr:hypothetical protein CF651_25810 [Paenibacillus rigui]
MNVPTQSWPGREMVIEVSPLKQTYTYNIIWVTRGGVTRWQIKLPGLEILMQSLVLEAILCMGRN